MSERLKRIALARIDLLEAWEKYRQAHSDMKKTEADKEFEEAYNSGVLYPSIYEVLGKVDIKTLYRLKKEFSDGDWTALVPRYKGNKKSEPALTDDEKRWFKNFLLMDSNISISKACKYTKFRLKELGIPSPNSSMTFRRWAEWFKKNNYNVWVAAREGKKALIDKLVFTIKRDWSQIEVGQLLFADGHRLNFRVINPFTGKPVRAALVGYMDAKSWYLAGYEIMLEESVQCITSALRDAIITLGKIPQFTYQDNGKAFRAKYFSQSPSFDEAGFQGLFMRLGIIPIFSLPYNPKSKSIERLFREIADMEKLVPSYVGSNAMQKPAHLKRNEKEIRSMHCEWVPTLEEAIRIIERFREFLGAQECPHVKGKTVKEVFDEGRGSGVDIDELDDLMMATEVRVIRQNGVRFLGADYYNDNLFGMRGKVIVKYSFKDISKIKLYSMDGRFLGVAERVMPVNPVANYIGEARDIETLKRLRALQMRQIRETFMHVRLAKGFDDRLIDITPKIEYEELKAPVQMQAEVQKKNEQQIFTEMWQRYEYLVRKPELTKDDRKWLEWYRGTEEFKLIFSEGRE